MALLLGGAGGAQQRAARAPPCLPSPLPMHCHPPGPLRPSPRSKPNHLAVPPPLPLPARSYAGGLILTICVVFSLGILATRAEPALNVLGRTVEKLSGGTFTAAMLIGAV